MNASYKIVLLGAFVLFIAVVGYYTLSGDDTPDDQDPVAQNPDGQTANNTGTTDNSPKPDNGDRATLNGGRTGGDDTPSKPNNTGTGNAVVIGDDGDEPDIGFDPDAGTPDADTGDTGTGTVGGLTLDPDDRAGPPPIGDGPTGLPDDVGTGTADTGDTGTGTGDTGTDTGTADTGDTGETATGNTDTGDTATTTARKYTIKPGDTFSRIAADVYGDESKHVQISQANPTVDPKKLQVGQVIVLPAINPNEPDTDDEPRLPAPGQDQSYTVQPNDNLSKIAKQFYGDETKWELIYARNRKTIGERPGMLKVGMKLIIPQPYSGAE